MRTRVLVVLTALAWLGCLSEATARVFDFTYESLKGGQFSKAGFTGYIVFNGSTITSFSATGTGYPESYDEFNVSLSGAPAYVESSYRNPHSWIFYWGYKIGNDLYQFQMVYGRDQTNIVLNPKMERGVITLQDRGSTQLAVASVPEPVTWALLMVGFVGLGLAGSIKATRKSSLPAARSAL